LLAAAAVTRGSRFMLNNPKNSPVTANIAAIRIGGRRQTISCKHAGQRLVFG
jgi:hypothetical protein